MTNSLIFPHFVRVALLGCHGKVILGGHMLRTRKQTRIRVVLVHQQRTWDVGVQGQSETPQLLEMPSKAMPCVTAAGKQVFNLDSPQFV